MRAREAACGFADTRSRIIRRTTASSEEALNFVDYGPQNSRGFRALKVWLALQQIGRAGYVESIGEDMRLSRKLFDLLQQHQEFEALTQNLSITTFRYVPSALRSKLGEPAAEASLNKLNEELLARVEQSGKAFFSNAVVGGRFAMRACIVNFRTSDADIEAVPEIVAELGDGRYRPIRIRIPATSARTAITSGGSGSTINALSPERISQMASTIMPALLLNL